MKIRILTLCSLNIIFFRVAVAFNTLGYSRISGSRVLLPTVSASETDFHDILGENGHLQFRQTFNPAVESNIVSTLEESTKLSRATPTLEALDGEGFWNWQDIVSASVIIQLMAMSESSGNLMAESMSQLLKSLGFGLVNYSRYASVAVSTMGGTASEDDGIFAQLADMWEDLQNINFDEVLDELGSRLNLQGLAGAVGKVQAIISASKNLGAVLLGEVREGSMGWMKSIAKSVAKFGRNFADAFSGFASAFANALNMMANAVSGIADSITAALKSVLGSLLGMGQKLLEKLLGLLAVKEDKLVEEPEWHANRRCLQVDYSALCPESWTSSSSGKDTLCQAPANYRGTCPTLYNFSVLSPLDKSRKETQCQIQWPCGEDACRAHGGRDWTVNCPHGWIEDDDSRCTPPPSYDGTCSRIPRTFALHTDSGKEKFANSCNAPWPCKYGSCMRKNYSRPCPRDWMYNVEETRCEPPSSLNVKRLPLECQKFTVGHVGFSSNLTLVTSPSQKADFELKCGVSWPCKQEKCDLDQQDFSHPCPRDWTNIMGTSGLCRAPSYFVEDLSQGCSKIMHFDDWELEERHAFASRCNVVWRCKGECEPDYATTCPEGWYEEPSGAYKGYCTGVVSAFDAPVEECSGPFDMRQWDDERKSSFENLCGAKWKCQTKKNGISIVPIVNVTLPSELKGYAAGGSAPAIEAPFGVHVQRL